MTRTLGAMVSRLVNAWRAADAAVRRLGASWYREARRVARAIAREAGVSLRCAAGVIAALSPRLTWTANVHAAGLVLMGAQAVPGVFSASLSKARAIAEGCRPLSVLRGPKVRAFYAALLGSREAVVVDVWMLRAVGWTRALSETAYHQVATAIALAAKYLGVAASRLQATVWVHTRGRS